MKPMDDQKHRIDVMHALLAVISEEFPWDLQLNVVPAEQEVRGANYELCIAHSLTVYGMSHAPLMGSNVCVPYFLDRVIALERLSMIGMGGGARAISPVINIAGVDLIPELLRDMAIKVPKFYDTSVRFNGQGQQWSVPLMVIRKTADLWYFSYLGMRTEIEIVSLTLLDPEKEFIKMVHAEPNVTLRIDNLTYELNEGSYNAYIT